MAAAGPGLCSLHDLWQEVSDTGGMQVAGGMNNTVRFLKKTLSGVRRICESTCVCAETQVLHTCLFTQVL